MMLAGTAHEVQKVARCRMKERQSGRSWQISVTKMDSRGTVPSGAAAAGREKAQLAKAA